MSKFLIDKYKDLVAYVPGEQPQDKKYLKLNTNESPFPPSKAVIEAISRGEVEKLNLYSDPNCKTLVSALAETYRVENKNVFVGNGSDEVLAFCFRAFSDEKTGMACPEISYGFYPVFADMFQIKYTAIPLNDDFTIDVKKYYNLGQNITIANPNAQTGLYLAPDKIESIVKNNLDKIVIIDEAYIDFGGESVVPLTKKYDNLIVVGTCSKSRSLAGGRVGFAIASAGLIEDLNKMKYSFNPYNINRLSMIAGTCAVQDKAYLSECTDKIIESRNYTVRELKKLGFYVTDSLANFVLAGIRGADGQTLYRALKDKGILVRFLSDEKLKPFIRITIGSMEQMTRFIATLKEVLKEVL